MAITVTQALQKTYMIHGKTLSADELDMWMLVLRSQNIPEHDAISALLKLLGESKFLPKPADVVEIAQGNTKAQQDYEAYRALELVRKAINPYSRPVFEDPRCSHLMAFFGGNVAMSNMQQDDLNSPATKAQARDFFKSLPKDVQAKKLDKMLDGNSYHFVTNSGELRPISQQEAERLTGETKTITTAQAVIQRIAKR